MLHMHGIRLHRGDPINPCSGVSCFCPYGLQTILVGPGNSTFKGRLRVVDTFPPATQLTLQTVETLCSIDENGDPLYKVAVSVEDDNATIVSALLTDAAATRLMGMPSSAALTERAKLLSNLRHAIDNRKIWQGTVQSVLVNGAKFFVVTSLEEKP